MPLKDWFNQRKHATEDKQLEAQGMDRVADATYAKLWQACADCGTNLAKADLKANLMVCPVCGYHHRIGARTRIRQLCTAFVETHANLHPADPLCFSDTEAYVQRQSAARHKAKLNDALVSGIGYCGQEPLALAVMDFAYMGGSMGSVVGEKITLLAEQAMAWQLPLLVVTSSGGARMQEGMFSLMQMVKTSAALSRFHEAGLLYTTLLTEPTFGGVTASYGTLGDLIIAEDGARIGFAGRRVIEQTIRQKLPADFQTASYLQQYGQVDMVLKRHAIAPALERLLALHRKASGKEPLAQQLPLQAPTLVAV